MARLLRKWGMPLVVFIFSLVLYSISIEPTVSFWDCGEFIGAATNLQVSHPPGSPVHMLLGRIFVIVFGMKSAAIAVNMLSAVASAFTILLLFLTLRLSIKLILASASCEVKDLFVAIEGASLIGALAFAVSDSFWYSSVEAEVYALSSLFTALVFYLAVTLFDDISAAIRGRRVYLISLLVGISVGIHQLNLLVIPPVVLIIWLALYRFSVKSVLKGLLLGFFVFLVAYALVPFLLFFFARHLELFFVNGFGFFKWSGALFFIIFFFVLLAFTILYARRKRWLSVELWLVLSLLYVVGLSCYLVVPIRASQNVPLNTGKPDNIFSFWGYVQRDQYGSTPLLYGNYFNAPVKSVVASDVHYAYSNGGYEESYVSGKVIYESGFSTVFPRMCSRTPEHANAYCSWASIPSNSLVQKDGSPIPPTFGQNLKFFLSYQVGFMYIRYFMWNFVGRQNDIQGHGDCFRGGWITGINILDAGRVGDANLLPASSRENKGRNVYFLFPFLLGVVGLIFVSFNPRLLWPMLTLFILTGVAIVVFLNQAPYQPRERDYAFLGSFYVWSIWIGLGCFYLILSVRRYLNKSAWTWGTLALLLLAVPMNMLSQNWDDHNRSSRYIARNLAYDYLRSCAPNAILFTYGDNDTFPLWYIQEAEGFRTDVRVVNINYLATGWGIGQLMRKQHSSEPIAFLGTSDFYSRNQTKVFQILADRSLVGNIHDNLLSSFSAIGGKKGVSTVPFVLSMSSEGASLPVFGGAGDTASIWKTDKTSLRIGDIALLDIVASNANSRPIYFASTVPNTLTLGLVGLSSWEGNLLRLNPANSYYIGKPNLSLTITNLVDSSMLAQSHSGYLDDGCRRFVRNHLRLCMQLADSLVAEHRLNDAVRVLDGGRKYFGDYCFIWNDIALKFIALYYKTGCEATANSMVETFTVQKFQELEYFKSLKGAAKSLANFDAERSTNALEEAISLQSAFNASKRREKLHE